MLAGIRFIKVLNSRSHATRNMQFQSLSSRRPVVDSLRNSSKPNAEQYRLTSINHVAESIRLSVEIITKANNWSLKSTPPVLLLTLILKFVILMKSISLLCDSYDQCVIEKLDYQDVFLHLLVNLLLQYCELSIFKYSCQVKIEALPSCVFSGK